jgi:hypothetical protein
VTPIEDLEERLSKLDESFKQAPSENESGFWMPDPGVYQCIFRTVDFFEAKKDGAAYIKLTFEIVLHSDFAGREVDLVFPLEPQGNAEYVEMRLSFLKRALKTLGIAVDDDDFTFAQVRPGSAIWDGVLDVPVEIEVKESKTLNESTGKPYVNAYLNARLGDPLPGNAQSQFASDIPAAPQEMAPAAVTDDDDDIPF